MKFFGRMLRASFVAPFAVIPGVILGLTGVYLEEIIQFDFLPNDRSDVLFDYLAGLVGLAVAGVITGWFLMPVVAVPMYVLLRLVGLDDTVPSALAGAVAGLLIGYFMFGSRAGAPPDIYVPMMFCGAFVGAAFCSLASPAHDTPETVWEAPSNDDGIRL